MSGKKIDRKVLFDFIDKSKWVDGPWRKEQDLVKFIYHDSPFSLCCLLLRNRKSGYWCGYVGIDQLNPFFDKDYEDVNSFLKYPILDYSGNPTKNLPEEFRVNNYYFFGFSLNHDGDLVPFSLGKRSLLSRVSLGHFGRDQITKDETYKNLGYAENVLEDLAKEIAQ